MKRSKLYPAGEIGGLWWGKRIVIHLPVHKLPTPQGVLAPEIGGEAEERKDRI